MEDWKHTPSLDHDLSLKDSLSSIKRESGLLGRISSATWWTLMKIYMRTCHKLEIVGSENLPADGPFVLIANHTSHLDVTTLAAALPTRLRTQVLPIAAGDMFFANTRRSIFSAVALNALPLWRKSGTAHSLQLLRQRLTETDSILILFPEGTRSRDGQLGDFKPGIGMVVAGINALVVPCLLQGCHEAMAANASKPKFTKVRIIIGKPVNYKAQPTNRAGWETIAKDLHQKVSELAEASPRDT